ncbi:MAG: acylphosphatase [bacterium]
MRKRVEVNYIGRVHGVGFRFTAERAAIKFKVFGYVKNVPNGKVKMVAEGEEEVLKPFLDAIYLDMGHYVEKFNIHWFPATNEFKRFEIRY